MLQSQATEFLTQGNLQPMQERSGAPCRPSLLPRLLQQARSQLPWQHLRSRMSAAAVCSNTVWSAPCSTLHPSTVCTTGSVVRSAPHFDHLTVDGLCTGRCVSGHHGCEGFQSGARLRLWQAPGGTRAFARAHIGLLWVRFTLAWLTHGQHDTTSSTAFLHIQSHRACVAQVCTCMCHPE